MSKSNNESSWATIPFTPGSAKKKNTVINQRPSKHVDKGTPFPFNTKVKTTKRWSRSRKNDIDQCSATKSKLSLATRRLTMLNEINTTKNNDGRNSTVCDGGNPFDGEQYEMSPIKQPDKSTRILPLKSHILESLCSVTESSGSRITNWLIMTQVVPKDIITPPIIVFHSPSKINIGEHNISDIQNRKPSQNNNNEQNTKSKKYNIDKEKSITSEVNIISPICINKHHLAIEENTEESLIGKEIVKEQPKVMKKKRRKRKRICMPPPSRYKKEIKKSVKRVKPDSIIKGKKLKNVIKCIDNAPRVRKNDRYNLRGMHFNNISTVNIPSSNTCQPPKVKNISSPTLTNKIHSPIKIVGSIGLTTSPQNTGNMLLASSSQVSPSKSPKRRKRRKTLVVIAKKKKHATFKRMETVIGLEDIKLMKELNPKVVIKTSKRFPKKITTDLEEVSMEERENDFESPINSKYSLISGGGQSKRKLSFYDAAKMISCDSERTIENISPDAAYVQHAIEKCSQYVANCLIETAQHSITEGRVYDKNNSVNNFEKKENYLNYELQINAHSSVSNGDSVSCSYECMGQYLERNATVDSTGGMSIVGETVESPSEDSYSTNCGIN